MTEKSVFHLSSILLLSQSPYESTLLIHGASIQDFQEAIFEFGGRITLRPESDDADPFMHLTIKIGNCEALISHKFNHLNFMLQKDAFSSDLVILDKGTKLTIMDNSYFVL